MIDHRLFNYFNYEPDWSVKPNLQKRKKLYIMEGHAHKKIK